MILQFFSTSMLSTTFLLHSLHLVWCLQLLVMMLLIVMLLLDVLVHEQLDVLVSRYAHGHLIDYIPKHALNSVFISALLETIVPVLMRGRWTPVIPGDMEKLIARNLSVKNQNEHENWLATYLGEWSWRLHNFGREVERPTAKTAQDKAWAVGRLFDYWNYTMYSPFWLLSGGIAQCTIPA